MFGQASYSKLPYPKGGAPLAERRHDQMVSVRFPPPRSRTIVYCTHTPSGTNDDDRSFADSTCMNIDFGGLFTCILTLH